MGYKKSASCPNKAQARLDTIINYYKKLFGRENIPAEKQYWSLAGPCYSSKGRLGEFSELNQMVSSGLITQDQYRGVDRDLEIIMNNRIAAPDATFIHGDFLETLKTYLNFNPAIIYADFISMSGGAIRDTAEVLAAVNYSKATDVLVVANLMLNNPYRNIRESGNKVFNSFLKNPRFMYCYERGWQLDDTRYEYNGTGASQTKMVTFFLTKTKTTGIVKT